MGATPAPTGQDINITVMTVEKREMKHRIDMSENEVCLYLPAFTCYEKTYKIYNDL
jgi:hypothetical protein